MDNTSTSSWSAARNICQWLGADLVVIKSDEENEFVFNLAMKGGSSIAWIGMERKTLDQKFYWIDGSPASSSNYYYTNWLPGQPDNQGNQENCGEIMKRGSHFKTWNDMPCSSSASFVLCQKPAISNSKG